MRQTQVGEPVLSIRGLEVTFPSEAGPVRALRGLDLDVLAGETLALLGESGSGKTAAGLAVMGLLPATAQVAGSIKLHGRELLGESDAELSQLRGRQVAMIFQDALASLTPVLTVGEQLVEAIQAHAALGRTAALGRATELLDLVGVPDPPARLRAFPAELSGGLRQRVMIAMAIAHDPDLIIADESTTALDPTVQLQVLDVLQTAQRETGAAIVLITHDLGVVAGLADRVSVLYAGKQVEAGPVESFFREPQMPYSVGLLASAPRVDRPATTLAAIVGSPPDAAHLPPGCAFAARCPIAAAECEQREPPLTACGDPAQFAACHRLDEVAARGRDGLFPAPNLASARPTQGEIVLTARRLTRRFPVISGRIRRRRIGAIHAVDGVDLELRAGQTHALVGESGSGKTSTMFEILDLAPNAPGSLQILGQNPTQLGKAGRRILRRDLQVVFQHPAASLDPRMVIFDVLAEPLRVAGVKRDQIAPRVLALIRLVGLDLEQLLRFPGQLSGGQQQRIAIARALALEPKIVLLDEPVTSLDVSVQAGIINLLRDLQHRLGLSYLLIGHDLAVVRQLADQVSVMCLGSIIESGPVEQVFQHPAHPYTRALLDAMPIPDPVVERKRDRILLVGDVPSPVNAVVGCKFVSRCPIYLQAGPAEQQLCQSQRPELSQLAAGQRLACHFPDPAPEVGSN